MALTTLDALNTIAMAVGETPYTEIDTEDTDIASMLVALDMANRAIQSTGWSFNTEENVYTAPDSDGYIQVPSTTLSVSDSRLYPSNLLLVQRGTKMYSRTKHSFIISVPVALDFTYLIPFEEVPEGCQLYIAAQAAAEYSMNQISSEFQLGKLRQTAEELKRLWMNSEDKSQHYSYLNPSVNPQHMKMLNRGGRSTIYTSR